jgi:hypothetical protein
VATTKMAFNNLPGYHAMKSLAGLPGLVSLVFLVSGCQTVSTPEQVTTAFWEAMADGDIDSAKQYATQKTQHLVTRQKNLEDAALKTGAVTIDGANATVSTILTLKKPENNGDLTFDTVLAKENDLWKVDYQQTLNNLFELPLGDIFNSLRALGDLLNKELKQQLPLIEEHIKSFGEELIKQLEEFRRQLEKSLPPEKRKPPSGVI